MPLAMSRQFLRCLGVASRRRGNHSNGTDTSRPSESVTIIASLVKRTSRARTEVGLTTLLPNSQHSRHRFALYRIIVQLLANIRRLSVWALVWRFQPPSLLTRLRITLKPHAVGGIATPLWAINFPSAVACGVCLAAFYSLSLNSSLNNSRCSSRS